MIRASILSTISMILPTSAATSFFVASDTGLDANPGTLAKPFQTLSKCLDMITVPGDVCTLREGVYEAINKEYTVSGTPAAPIEVRGYEREKATIQQGFYPVWRQESTTNTWSADFNLDALVATQQGFVSYYERGIRVWKGNEILQEATWPGQLSATFAHPTWTAASGSNDNLIYYPSIPNVDLTGAKVLTFNGDQVGVDARTVTSSGPGWIRISGYRNLWSKVGPGSRFWIQGVRNMIDNFNQWGYDPVQKRIYLRTTGYNPNQLKVRIQTSSVAFVLKGVSNWNIYNLAFQGTSPVIRSGTHHIRYSGLYVREPGLVRWPDEPYQFTQFSGMMLGADSKIHHSTLDGCDARCLFLVGDRDTVDNNLIQFGGRIGQFEGAISVGKPGAVIRRNRILQSGRDAIGFQTLDVAGAIVRRNSIEDCGILANEAGGVSLFGIVPAGGRVRIDSNLIRRIRGNGSAIYLEGVRGVDIFRNIFTDNGTSITLVGDGSNTGMADNRIVSNSGYRNRNSLFLRVPGSLAGSLLANNILDGGYVQGIRHGTPLVENPLSLSGLVATGLSFTGNLGPGINALYKSSGYDDFSLLPGSPAMGTGTILPGVNFGAGADPALSYLGANPDMGAINSGTIPWPFGNYDETIGNPILGMEDPARWHSYWTTDRVVTTYSTDRIEGGYSLALSPLPWAPLESDPIEWDLVKGAIGMTFYFKVPVTFKWIGTMQIFLDAPSLGIYNYHCDNIPLGSFTQGIWAPQGILFDQVIMDKLRFTNRRITDFRIRMAYGADPSTSPLLIDNISFYHI